jgi:hypothetical protein
MKNEDLKAIEEIYQIAYDFFGDEIDLEKLRLEDEQEGKLWLEEQELIRKETGR